MPDTIQTNDESVAPADAAGVYQWVQAAAARVDAGFPLDQSGEWDPSRGKFGIPPGYDIENGHLSQNAGNLRAGVRGAIGVGLGILGGFGAGELNDLVSGAGAVSGSAGNTIPAAFGNTAVDTLSTAAPAAGGGALLPSTQIGNGMITAAPSSTSSLTAGAGTSLGLPDWLKRAQDVGDSLSAMSAGRAEGRVAEGVANQNQNRAAVDLYNTELNAPRTIARNAVKGDVLANAQDVQISRPSTIPDFTISGGLRPSMFSDATRQTGRNISTAAANTPIPTPTAPILPPLPQANWLDSTLNTASTISGLSRAVPPEYWGSIGKGIKGLFT